MRGTLCVDHLLGVLPDVLVTPLAVTEADHGLDLGQERVEHARRQQRVEPLVRPLAHHHPIQVLADVLGSERGEIGGIDEHHGPVGRALLGARDRPLEGVDGPLGVA